MLPSRRFVPVFLFTLTAALLLHESSARAQFSYNVSIAVPAGVHGMQPDLALNYSPGSGNGFAGVGWIITGLPSITRANYGNGVLYQGNDTFAHSDLGILVAQPDGTFRTKNESYFRFTTFGGTCGDATCSWSATDPNGTVYAFGDTSDSRVSAPGTPTVREWYLSTVTDILGNSYSVSYTSDGNGKAYPAAIAYTKGPGLPANRTVSFAYEPRPDTEVNYTDGYFASIDLRLKWIYVYSLGQLVRQYRLDYTVSTSTGRSLLTGVQEYGSDGATALPEQTFAYQEVDKHLNMASWLTVPGGWPGGTSWQNHFDVLSGDFNGDGKQDMAYVQPSASGKITIQVGVSTGDGFSYGMWEPSGGAWLTDGISWEDDATFATGDFNGDGLNDIAYIYQVTSSDTYPYVGIDVYLSRGTSFEWQPRWAADPNIVWLGLSDWQGYGTFLTGDFNGDSITDIAYVREAQYNNEADLFPPLAMFVFESTGASFAIHNAPNPLDEALGFSTGWLTGGGLYFGGSDYQISSVFMAGDYDGDGRTDIAYIYDDPNNGDIAVDIARSFGDHFQSEPWLRNQGYWVGQTSWYDYAMFVPSDFNGDGKMDLGYVFTDNGNISMDVQVSTGSSFVKQRYITRVGAWPGASWNANAMFMPADYNGDGKADMAYAHNIGGVTEVDVFLTNANGYADYTTWTQEGPWASNSGTFSAGNFDGSGRASLAYAQGDSAGNLHVNVYAPTPVVPDFMIKAYNGHGGAQRITYEASTALRGVINPSSSAPGISNTAPQQLVTSVTTSDGLGGQFTTSYTYEDARIIPGPPAIQRDLGFAVVTTQDMQTGLHIVNTTSQVPGFEHMPVDVRTLDGNQNLIAVQTTTYALLAPAVGTEKPVTVQQVSTAYNLGQPGASQTVVLSYDQCGNTNSQSMSAANLPTLTTENTYSCDTSTWILRRLLSSQTSSQGTLFKSTTFTWSGNTLQSKSEWLNTNDSWLTTSYTYDQYGNLTSATLPTTGDGLTRSTTIVYDPVFSEYPTSTTDALGHTTNSTFDYRGLITAKTDANGNKFTCSYDVFGRLLTEERPDGGITSYQYVNTYNPDQPDSAATQGTIKQTMVGSQLLTSADYFDGLGIKYRTVTSGDNGNQIYVDIVKDVDNRTSGVSEPHFANDPAVYSVLAFDSAGRPVKATNADGSIMTYSYGADFNATTDAAGHTTTRYFDAGGRVSAMVDSLGQTTSYAYDAVGNPISVTLPDGSRAAFSYDSLGRKTSSTDPLLGTTQYTYDSVGNLVSAVHVGKQALFTYDALNRLATKQVGNDNVVAYTYDDSSVANGIGRLTEVADASGTTGFSYDVMGNRASFSRTIDGQTYAEYFTYDTNNRLVKSVFPDGSVAAYSYAGGRYLSQVTLNGAIYATWPSYSASGRPEKVVYGNGVTSNYYYDTLGRLSSLRTQMGNTTLQSLDYTFGPGQALITAIADNRSDKMVGGVNTDETQEYTYDALDRLNQAVGVWGTKSFAYDSSGDVTTFGGSTTRNLRYNGQQVISGTNLYGVIYDTSGNMLQKILDGVIYQYAWDGENRLTSTATYNAVDVDITSILGGPAGLGCSLGVGGILRPQNGNESCHWLDSMISLAPLPLRGATGRGHHPVRGHVDTTTYTYDYTGQRVKVQSDRMGTSTVYVDPSFQVAFGDGGITTSTINLYANGIHVASIATPQTSKTLFGQLSRESEECLAGTVSSRSVRGVISKISHLALSLSYADEVKEFALGFVTMGFLCLFLCTMLGARMRTPTPRRGFAVLAAFALTISACLPPFTSGSGSGHGVGPKPGMGNKRVPLIIGSVFYHQNHIQSTSVLTDTDGRELARYSYLPFGEVSTENSFGFDLADRTYTDQIYDSGTRLYYYNARYYDPAIGRFISADNIIPNLANAQAWNRYSYVLNNPIIYQDPTGHHWWNDAWNDIVSAAKWLGNAVWNIIVSAGDFFDAAAHFWASWKNLEALGALIGLTIFAIALFPFSELTAAIFVGALMGAFQASTDPKGDPLLGALVGGALGAAGYAGGLLIPDVAPFGAVDDIKAFWQLGDGPLPWWRVLANQTDAAVWHSLVAAGVNVLGYLAVTNHYVVSAVPEFGKLGTGAPLDNFSGSEQGSSVGYTGELLGGNSDQAGRLLGSLF